MICKAYEKKTFEKYNNNRNIKEKKKENETKNADVLIWWRGSEGRI